MKKSNPGNGNSGRVIVSRASPLSANSNSNVSTSSASTTKSRIVGQTSSLGRPAGVRRKQQPVRESSIRSYVQANSRVSNITALFHDEMDTQQLSAALVRNARKSGVLNLSSRNLISVPMKVWKINQLDENERSTVSVSLDDNSEDKWWEFVDLQKLIIANNYIKDIPCDISNLYSLQTFDAHDNQIITVSKDIGSLSNLTKLDLSYNSLPLIPEEVGNLKRLVELNLSHNNIEELPTSLGNLSSLRIMDLSHNNLRSIPEDLGFLSFLQSLNISNNKLTDLPEDIGGLTGLRTLDLSENEIERCPNGMSELVHLEILYLKHNKLDAIPDLSRAKNIKELHMQHNRVRVFDSSAFADTKINLLDFRVNKLDTVKINPDDLEFLIRFYLDNNDIGQLPNELALLPSLKSLTLDGNPIRGIRVDILQRGTVEVLRYLRGKIKVSENAESGGTTGIGSGENIRNSNRKSVGATAEELSIDPYKCKSSRSMALVSRNIQELDNSVLQLAADTCVTCIDLSKNTLMSLPPTIDLCQEWLVELQLDFNKLKELPSTLAHCSRLQYLTVQNNQITRLPDELEALKSLREINLAFNRFESIPSCLYSIPALEIINLASNKVEALEYENLSRLQRLAVLDVRNNNIGTMPPEIGLLTQLKSLVIDGNAFRVPNYQIISQGTDTILSYLRNRIPSST